MYKYEIIIDDFNYNTLFLDHLEAADFLDEKDRDGVEIIVKSYYEVTADEIFADEDFEWSYRAKIASVLLLPNHCDFLKQYL